MHGQWKRSSSLKPSRSSNNVLDLAMAKQGRTSRSTERPKTSRIPLRSSSSQRSESVAAPTMGLQRSKSTMHLYSGSTPVTGKNQYTPSQSGYGKITPGTNLSNKKVFVKDIRKLQDKEYMKESIALVQSYFQENCAEVLINGSDIQPMTRKLFIDMLNHLFNALGLTDKGKPLQFELSTYEKELPYWLKSLEYPGQITKGCLQTVNVPHNFPYILGLFTWLVKLLMVGSLFNAEVGMGLESEDKSRYWAAWSFKNVLTAYPHYASDENDRCDEIMAESVEHYNKLFGVSEQFPQIEEEIKRLKQELEERETQHMALKDAFDEAEQRLLFAQQQSAKDHEDIKKKELEFEDAQNKLQRTQKNIITLKHEIELTQKDMVDLNNIISSQDMSVNELADVQKKCGNLDKVIKYLEKEAEVYQDLITRTEYDNSEKRDKILQNMYTINRNLIQTEQYIPELKEFHIHTEPEDSGILVELDKNYRALERIKNEYVTKCLELQNQSKEEQRIFQIKKDKLKQLMETVVKLKESITRKEDENGTLKKNFEEKERNLKGESEQWSEKLKLAEEKKKEYQDHKNEKQRLEERVEFLMGSRSFIKLEEKIFWRNVYQAYKHVPEYIEKLKEVIGEINVEMAREEEELLRKFEEENCSHDD